MRVLWLCNIVLPELSDEFDINKSNIGGWLSGMWSELKKYGKFELAICTPLKDEFRMKDGIHDGYQFYSFKMQSDIEGYYDQVMRFKEILSDYEPEIIDIWGTEYIHTRAMIEACKLIGLNNRVLLNIQGILHLYIKNYMYGVEESTDTYLLDSMIRRSSYEVSSIKNVKYVCGRTDWDRAAVCRINKKIQYFHCGEILRDIFYEKSVKWTYKKCNKHSIFISQANYPIKGLHTIIEELGQLGIEYSDLQIRVGGIDATKTDTQYGELLKKMINEFGLSEKITFLGMLDMKQMYDEYLRANVFLSPSIVENSSNSICEALMVGTPVVSSYVGGIPSIITHTKEGFLYSLQEPYMSFYYIKMIFDNQDIAESVSKKGIEKAMKYNNRHKCVNTLKQIYKYIEKM